MTHTFQQNASKFCPRNVELDETRVWRNPAATSESLEKDRLRTRLPSSLLFLPFLVVGGVAQTGTSPQPEEVHLLTVAVSDENNVPVAAARVLLESQGATRRCETDVVGRCQFRNLSESAWRLTVEKEGFYIFALPAVQKSGILEITLTHQHEVRETVNVIESSPAIDPSQVSSQEQLSGIDITNIPYPNTRDYRYALNFIPGVVLDQKAQPHLAGSETYQMLALLDGFNVTQPASGELLVRVSTDALRSVSVETSRLPAQYG